MTDALLTASSDRAERRWWRGPVIYENHLPSFCDGNGDGIGDLDGLVASLDYLAGTLGVSALWVGPFFRSPLLDQGFDIVDHCDVEPVFGSLDTVDRLLAEAHARGVRIIVDYVPNHTSDQHPWFLESRSSREGPKRDWYVWADTPNNWTSEAGGSVWQWDEPTGQFYLHSHLKQQPDLNWRNPDVRRAMLDVLRFWLDRGVDGFRIDVAHMLMKDPDLRDNPPNPGGESNPYDLQHPNFASQLHVHDRMHSDLHGVLREIRKVLDEYPGDRVAIGEVEAMDWERWAEFYGPALDQLHLPFAFKLIETPWEAGALAEVAAGLDAALPDGLDLLEIVVGDPERGSLADRLDASEWQIRLPGVEPAEAAAAVDAFLAAREVEVERMTKKGVRTFDCRAAVASLSATSDADTDQPCAILVMVVRQATPAVRPDDVLAGLRAIAGLVPSVWPHANRAAQGPLDERTGTVGDPFVLDRDASR